jgi:hypothetical protein
MTRTIRRAHFFSNSFFARLVIIDTFSSFEATSECDNSCVINFSFVARQHYILPRTDHASVRGMSKAGEILPPRPIVNLSTSESVTKNCSSVTFTWSHRAPFSFSHFTEFLLAQQFYILSFKSNVYWCYQLRNLRPCHLDRVEIWAAGWDPKDSVSVWGHDVVNKVFLSMGHVDLN